MAAHEGALLVVYAHVGGAEPHYQRRSRKRRVGRVEVLALDADLAVLVGLGPDVAHDVERFFRQASHGCAVLRE